MEHWVASLTRTSGSPLELDLSDGEIILGADPDCSLQVAEPEVAPRHVRIVLHEGLVLVEDLGSQSGTEVNGDKISAPVTVAPPVAIQFGEATLMIERAPEPAAASDPSAAVTIAPKTEPPLRSPEPISISIPGLAPPSKRPKPHTKTALSGGDELSITIAGPSRAAPKPQPEDPPPDRPDLAVTVVSHRPPEPPGNGNVHAEAIALLEGHYRLMREIARGGMGKIYFSEDPQLKREVAVKVSTVSGDDGDPRFTKEAEVLAQLAHPNVVPIHNIGVDEFGRPFYAMKLVKGRTLQTVINQLRDGVEGVAAEFSRERLLTVFRKVCDAMAFAHSKRILHRDLKPDNVMVGEYGEVLVMDWGLAKILGEKDAPSEGRHETVTQHAGSSDFGMTMEGEVMGTPQYMSPEQARGEVAGLDARSDIYSLGGILFAMLTLRPPIEGSTLKEVLTKVKNGEISSMLTKRGGKGGEVQPPTKMSHDVPEALRAVTLKAMAKEKEKRYGTVEEFAADIEAYQNGFATRAEGAGLVRQLVLLVKRHKAVSALVGVLMAAGPLFTLKLAASEQLAKLNAQKARENEKRAEKSMHEARENMAKAQESEKRAIDEREATRKALSKAKLTLAEAAYGEQDITTARALLKEIPEDLQDATWHYLLENSDSSIRSVRAINHTATKVDFSRAEPHPKLPGVFGIFPGPTYLWVMEPRTGAVLLSLKTGVTNSSLGPPVCAFTPDGTAVAIAQANLGAAILFNLRTGEKIREIRLPAPRYIQFSPDGKTLLSVEGAPETKISLWDVLTGERVWETPAAEGTRLYPASFAPNGKFILAARPENRLVMLSSEDGSVQMELPALQNGAASLAVLGSSREALIGEQNGFLRRLDLSEGRILWESRPSRNAIRNICAMTDGRRFLVTYSAPSGAAVVQVMTTSDGSVLQTLTGLEGVRHTSGISYHPSGEVVGWATGGSAKVWVLPPSQSAWRISRNGIPNAEFMGSDDFVLSPPVYTVQKADVSLLKFGKKIDAPNITWSSEARYRDFSVSGNGKLAAFLHSKQFEINVFERSGEVLNPVSSIRTEAQKGSLSRALLSPDGSRVFTGKRVLKTKEGDEVAPLQREVAQGESPLGVGGPARWINDEMLLEVSQANPEYGYENLLMLWNTTTGERVKTLPLNSETSALAVAPNGKRFAEAGFDKRVRIRDSTTLEVLSEFRAHDARITALAWHPTLPILASHGEDLVTRLTHVETGRRLKTVSEGFVGCLSMSFSPSGNLLLQRASWGTSLLDVQDVVNGLQPKEDPDGGNFPMRGSALAELLKTAPDWRHSSALYVEKGSKEKRLALPLPGQFADAGYDMRLIVRQLKAQGGLVFALPVGKSMVLAGIDTHGIAGGPDEAFQTGLLIPPPPKAGVPEGERIFTRQIDDYQQHHLEISVKPAASGQWTVTILLDRKTCFSWTGSEDRLKRLPTAWEPVCPSGRVTIGAQNDDWLIYHIRMRKTPQTQ